MRRTIHSSKGNNRWNTKKISKFENKALTIRGGEWYYTRALLRAPLLKGWGAGGVSGS